MNVYVYVFELLLDSTPVDLQNAHFLLIQYIGYHSLVYIM